MQNNSCDRREFLAASTLAAIAIATPPLFAAEGKRYRAAVIGHTGQGDYGHGLDVVFTGRDNIEVVAVADPNDAGRAKAKQRSRAQRDYADYRELLAKEKPNLVSVAMRWSDPHHAICEAALEAGAHLYVEKPFTTSLAEADELLALAEKKNLKIAVAHQMHLAPIILALKQELGAGLIGDLLQLRAHGKQDSRAGGEDMIVLGTHLFDLMRLFAGDPLWCTAHILHRGREALMGDIRAAGEKIGPVLGDEIEAQFSFPKGVHGTFTSRARNRETAGHWGIELIGSKSAIRLLADIVPRVFVRSQTAWSDSGAKTEWSPMPWDKPPDFKPGVDGANGRMLDDLLASIEKNQQPACSGLDATKAIEMAMAIYHAGLSRERITFPLKARGHPLRYNL
jgi:predicted dehydrogenase